MSQNLSRRGFLKDSVVASTGASLALSFEEQALMAKAAGHLAAYDMAIVRSC